MKLFDLFTLVLKNVKSRLSRTLYSTIGVAIGIGAILFLVSLGYGLQKALLERITTEVSLLTLDISSSEAEVINLNETTIEKIEGLPDVEAVSPQAVYPGQVTVGGLNSEAVINLVDSDFFNLSGIRPQIGRAFNDEEATKIVINSLTAELFSLEKESILGKKFRVSIFRPKEETEIEGEKEELSTETITLEEEYEVVGVIAESDASSANIYLNRKGLKGFAVSNYQFAKVKVKTNAALDPVRDTLINMGFMVSSLSDTVSQTNKIFLAIQIILGIFGIVGLIVAAIGLINTMSITLLERTSEIGIMRALGASSQDVRRLFLMESTLNGFVGGIIGVVLGIGVGKLFNFGLNLLAKTLGGQAVNIFYYPFWFILFIILLSTFVGFIAGFWPAKRAASLNTLEALRYK